MNKKFFLSILTLAFVSFGCKKDDKKDNTTPPKPTLSQVIVGNWTIQNLSITGQAEFLGILVNFKGTGKDFAGSAEFKADKSIASTASCGVSVVLVLPTGEIPSPRGDLPLNDLFDGSTYEVKSDTELIITTDGEAQTATVTEFTSTSMSIETKGVDPDTGADLDIKVTLRKS